jgi:hypothetical protein
MIEVDFKLKIFKREYTNDNLAWTHLRFAVVDLKKSEDYPSNFVSMLPMRIDSAGKIPSTFTKFFGNKSLETAIRLLTEALKKEDDSEIKAEIERRLNLLEPNPTIQIKCRVCKKFFQTQKDCASKQKICPKCIQRFAKTKNK